MWICFISIDVTGLFIVAVTPLKRCFIEIFIVKSSKYVEYNGAKKNISGYENGFVAKFLHPLGEHI